MAHRTHPVDLARLHKRRLAFEAFQDGASLEDACRMHGVETREVEDLIRLGFELNLDDLSDWLGRELGRTSPADIARIREWLLTTMIWVGMDEAGLGALPGLAQESVRFSDGS